MKAELQQVCAGLFGATVNSVYQGVLVCILVGFLLRLLVRTNAATRHAVWLATLALVVMAVPVHYWLAFHSVAEELGRGALPAEAKTAGPIPALAGETPFGAQPLESSRPGDPQGQSWKIATLASPQQISPEAMPSGDPDLDPRTSRAAHKAESSGASPDSTMLSRILEPVAWNVESSASVLVAEIFLVLWLVIAGFRVGTLAWRVAQLRKLTDGAWAPDPDLQALFGRLLKQGPGFRNARLLISPRNRCPLVLGFFRPVILLPAELAVQAQALETEHVLGHELAHVRRYDDWANLMQHLIRAVLFFHPAVWWIARELSLQREIACDDHVLQHHVERRSYALSLASVASRIKQPTPLLAPGVLNNHSQLQQRINMILNTRRNSSAGLAKARLTSIISAAALVAAVAVGTGPRFVLAQTPTPVAAIATTPASDAAPVAVSAVSAAPVVPVIVAQADEPPPPAPAVAPGPKFKPGPDDVTPAEVTPPEPPTFPIPRVARVKPSRGPQPEPDASPESGSIEERLRHLEKMVKSLMAQQNPKHPKPYVYMKDGAEPSINIDEQAMEKMKQSAERQAARAAEQAERAAEQAKRATKDLQARIDQEQQGKGEFREALQKQLESLRKAREELGQEMQKLERQIQKLERQQERGERTPQRRSEAPGQELQAQSETPQPGQP